MINKFSSLLFALWLASLIARADGPIHLKTRNLTAAAYPVAEVVQSAGYGPGHLVLQFSGTPQAGDIQQLEQRGAQIVGTAPDDGLVISVSQPVSLDGLAIQWAGPLLPEDKISPLLSAAADAGPAPVLIEFHPDVPVSRALDLLHSVNVQILEHPDLAPNHRLVSAFPGTMTALAGFDEVAYIFPASNDLLQSNHVMACTSAVMGPAPVWQYVNLSTGWDDADANGVVQLDYVFTEMSPKLPVASTQSEIIRALQEWTKYTNINFVPAGTATGDHSVAIMFAEGSHGDAFPFPAGSPVLAHTFFPAPLNPEPIAGQMHLNEDQDWHIGSGIDVYTVALHEAGHALGLGHSDDPTAVMYPYYRFGAVLAASDIAAIQSLYGNPNPLTISTPIIPTLPVAPVVPSDPVVPSNPVIPSDPADPSAPTDPSAPGSPSSPAPSGSPSLTVTSPGMTISGTSLSSITVAGTATSNVTSVAWKNSTGTSGTATGTTAWSASIPLLIGTNTLTVTAFDADGDSAWRALTVVRQ
jgi:hypothetical protein